MNKSGIMSWDEYFMSISYLSSLRSKDPNTRHGSTISDEKNRIVSTGYNGFIDIPDNDNVFPWTKDDKNWNKYQFVIHSEANAILNAKKDLLNCKLYLYSEKNYLPCQECTKLIVQSGIKEVIMVDIIKNDTDEYNWKPVLFMFEKSNVKLRTLGDVFLKGYIFSHEK